MQSPHSTTDPVADPGADARARCIVAAAYALLDRDGLDALTIRAVLDATGLSRRAVYERFGGKDDLMLAVFQHTIRLGTAQFAALAAPIAEPLDRLEAIVRAIVVGRGDGDGRLGAAMSREHLRLSELRAALAPLLGLLTRELARGTARGTVRAGDAAGMATMIYKLVSTTVHEELIGGGRADDRAALAADLWDFCRRAIAA